MGCIGVESRPVFFKKIDFVFSWFRSWQGAMPDIIGNTKEEFFASKLEMVKKCAEICYEELKKIPCISCPCKPEGSMFTMVMNQQESDYSLANLNLKLIGLSLFWYR